ncbi:MAG: sel1 repeat family protein [Helicobacter sp.]|nr:sel1 repeat family protein [Helicobacter sp.]MDE5816520.1 hypothetical protein [Helicobacter sp.]
MRAGLLLLLVLCVVACASAPKEELPIAVTPPQTPDSASVSEALLKMQAFHQIVFQTERKNEAKALAQQACRLGLGEGCLFSVFSEPVSVSKEQSAEEIKEHFLSHLQTIKAAQIEMDAHALRLATYNCANDVGSECAIVGGIYERGDGVEADLKQARAYYEKACALDSVHGCLALNRFTGYASKQYAKTFALLERACAADDPFLCYMAGEWSVISALHNKQTSPNSPFLQDAKAYYDKACKLGFDAESLGLEGSCAQGNIWQIRVELLRKKATQKREKS